MPRFNYTGRKKINRKDVLITVFEENGILSYNADVDFSNCRLPSNAPVYIEAYRQTSWMRFEHGTVGSLKPRSNNRLYEFDSLDGIRFRIKVSQGEGIHGKLLAIADKIQPVKPEEGDAGRLCILPTKSEEMDCIWRLEFGTLPILLISKKAGSKDALARSPEFISLVYPAVLGEVLNEMKDTYDDWYEEEDCWQKQWLTFVNLLPGVGEMPDVADEDGNEAFKQWQIDAMESFSRQLKIPETFNWYHEEGE